MHIANKPPAPIQHRIALPRPCYPSNVSYWPVHFFFCRQPTLLVPSSIEKDPYPIDALPTCNHALAVCQQSSKCIDLFESFKTHCKVRENKCRMEDLYVHHANRHSLICYSFTFCANICLMIVLYSLLLIRCQLSVFNQQNPHRVLVIAVRTHRNLCYEAWAKLRLSPMFGCICPNNHIKRRCDRIFSMVNHNPCVGK